MWPYHIYRVCVHIYIYIFIFIYLHVHPHNVRRCAYLAQGGDLLVCVRKASACKQSENNNDTLLWPRKLWAQYCAVAGPRPQNVQFIAVPLMYCSTVMYTCVQTVCLTSLWTLSYLESAETTVASVASLEKHFRLGVAPRWTPDGWTMSVGQCSPVSWPLIDPLYCALCPLRVCYTLDKNQTSNAPNHLEWSEKSRPCTEMLDFWDTQCCICIGVPLSADPPLVPSLSLCVGEERNWQTEK